MNDDIFLKKTYAGIVEDNNDPKRLGRIKVRVFEVYSDIETQDIPWASPWKDLNGENFILPERGKVVTVIFENGDLYKPEYIYAEHFNINLENKLKQLSPDDYKSMKSILFNHKTQIYVNESEGLKIDHKFNNINITEKNINLNLKDNYGKINIGDESSNQESILGTNFLEWFDEFINILSGQEGGPFLGNLASPVIPTPALLESIAKYKAFKQPKFLSKNVFIVDNYDVTSIRQNKEDRQNNTQIGDDYRSSTSNTNLVDFDLLDYDPLYGDGNSDNPITSENVDKSKKESNPNLINIINTMRAKGYIIEEKPFYMNLVAVRNQYEGQDYSTAFVDKLWVIWKNDEDKWESKTFPISTMPGWKEYDLPNGEKVDWKNYLGSDDYSSDSLVENNNLNVSIKVKSGKITDISKDVLKTAAKKSDNKTITISSTQRPPSSQARAMITNLERDWENGDRTGSIQKDIYSNAGDKVIQVYVDLKSRGVSKDDILKAMEEKIIEIGPMNISKHASDISELNVMDIPKGNLRNPLVFLSALRSDSRVKQVLDENGVYHVEIKQS